MAKPVVHIIGAGLAGLAAAVRLAGEPCEIVLYEAARQAGGRCRSYFDATLGMVIDNGNHLLLSGNRAALDFLATIGGADRLSGPAQADFSFVDLATKERWRVRPNAGPIPWWIFVEGRGPPGANWRDYLALLALLLPGKDRPIGAVMACEGALYERLWRPFLLAALNIEPSEGSSHLAAAIVRETLAKGGGACRPLVAHGLSAAFIEPAIAHLTRIGADIRLDHRLRGFEFSGNRIAGLDFGDARAALGAADKVVLAAPAPVAQDLAPNLQAPQSFRAIVNAHFKIAPPKDVPAILGVVNGTIEWVFSFEDRLSVTISGADRLLDVAREELAATIWAEVAEATQLEKPLPPWQIIKEKRATFAATPEENARRPGARTAYANLALAGDWTATGLPATIEGAIRSGNRAADAIMQMK
ncbi:hydroxysqualene dehydroxylase HpnE [Methylocapsa aurea]|uniref:hydroxysqualene dehydroxylase HpnE n=1 Tax=Methylocapsa aurea TaxID=663610 RepID=UPI00055A4498|nr:hydroxysqualene dehydroxylase HpnE [Methylocapsa aurea]